MARWHRRLMRLMLPFGIAWFAYGVLALVAEAPGGPHPLAVLNGIIAIFGGILFVANWWVYRRETR
jgi:hypothetical protein